MSSIWTPNGEHEIRRPAKAPAQDNTQRQPAEDSVTDPVKEIQDIEQRLRSMPAEEIVANHCYGLFQLAAIHLSSDPPGIKEASLAIDAMGAVTEKLAGRLGEAEHSLREGLAQLQLVYVQIAKAAGTDNGTKDDREPTA